MNQPNITHAEIPGVVRTRRGHYYYSFIAVTSDSGGSDPRFTAQLHLKPLPTVNQIDTEVPTKYFNFYLTLDLISNVNISRFNPKSGDVIQRKCRNAAILGLPRVVLPVS